MFEEKTCWVAIITKQMMSATAVLRFWTLVSCLAYFLDEHRARLEAQRPGIHITLGDACRELRAEHQPNLLLWLEEQYCSGTTTHNL